MNELTDKQQAVLSQLAYLDWDEEWDTVLKWVEHWKKELKESDPKKFDKFKSFFKEVEEDKILQETQIKDFVENKLTGFAAYVFETPSGDGVVSFGKTENSFKCVSPRLPPIKVSGKQGKEVKPNDGIFSIVA